MDITVFYSWQSDLSGSTNRYFIQEALEKAVEEIHSDEAVSFKPIVDRDTYGTPGSPNIASTIFEKIDKSDIFVCDVSIIDQECGPKNRATPNPNVLLELGYAIRSRGHKRIILVFNEAYGRLEDLPFDLKQMRATPYKRVKSAPNKAKDQDKLQRILNEAIRLIIQTDFLPAAVARLPRVNLIDRLREYQLEDINSSNFANPLTGGLIIARRTPSNEIVRESASHSTVFLAIPAIEMELDSSLFFKEIPKMFGATSWYKSSSAGQAGSDSRYFSHKILPIKGEPKIEQNSIVVVDRDPGLLGEFYILRVNLNGEVSLAISDTAFYFNYNRDKRVNYFLLGAIIHLLWAFLSMVKEFQETVNTSNNYHINVALTNTKGTYLGNFVEGYPDIHRDHRYFPAPWESNVCNRPNVLITREDVNLSKLEYKVLPEEVRSIANEIARAFGYQEAHCFDSDTGQPPDSLWPYP